MTCAWGTCVRAHVDDICTPDFTHPLAHHTPTRTPHLFLLHLPYSEDVQAKQGVDACACMGTGERLELMNEELEPQALLLPPTGVTFMMCKG